jgi:hypothetical protein
MSSIRNTINLFASVQLSVVGPPPFANCQSTSAMDHIEAFVKLHKHNQGRSSLNRISP